MEKSRKNCKKIYIGIILLLITLLASIPLFFNGIEYHFGQDTAFHINRIEGLYLELKNGVFPVRMQSFWLNGYGYPVSIYYPDLFLYIPALLRLLGLPVVMSYKIYVLLVNLTTVLISYFSFKFLFKKEYIALVCSAAYTLCAYRFENVYIRGAVGEYTAMAFLPLVVVAIYRMYNNESADRGTKTKRKKIYADSFLLAIALTGILSSHILSVEIVGIVTAIYAIVRFKKTFTGRVLITYALAAVETLLFNLYFIVPFIDYYLHEDVNINNVVSDSRHIQASGAHLYQYINFFENPFGNVEWKERIALNIGPVLMITLLVAIIVIVMRRATIQIKILTLSVLLLLFVSSDIFPWDKIRSLGKLGQLFCQVQFPWRYLGPTSLLATLLLGCILSLKMIDAKQIKISLISACSVILVIMTVWFSYEYDKCAEYVYYADTQDLDSCNMGFAEYLLVESDRDELIEQGRDWCDASSNVQIDLIERRGCEYKVKVTSDGEGYFEIPMLNYRYYEATDSNGKKYDIVDGSNNVIKVLIDEPVDTVITVSYNPPVKWFVSVVISIISIALLIIGFCYSRKTERT